MTSRPDFLPGERTGKSIPVGAPYTLPPWVFKLMHDRNEERQASGMLSKERLREWNLDALEAEEKYAILRTSSQTVEQLTLL